MKILFQTIQVFVFLSISVSIHSQSFFKKDVVYSGRNFTWGMNKGSYDLTVLLRTDGTFCEDLEEPDWQTKVTGHYKKIPQGVFLKYVDNSIENDTIFFEKDEDGYESVSYGGAQMVKMEIPNSVPPGYYSFSRATSSGGMGTGTIYVGTSSYEGYNFYENGTFDRSSSGGVVVSDSHVGGGSSSENSGKGKYTIKNGLLTLTYNDGTIEKHSFFYDNDGGKEFMVAIDGSIFFYGDEDESEETAEILENSPQRASEDERLTESKLKDIGAKVLNNIKQAHGGSQIDQVKTAKATMLVSGMRFKILIDFAKRYVRLESLEPSFNYIEQLENNKGWVYQNNMVQNLGSDRIDELQTLFIGGVFGLKSEVLAKTEILDIREAEDGMMLITLNNEGKIFGFIYHKSDHTLAGSFLLKNGENEITTYENMEKIEGVYIPLKEITQINTDLIEVSYETFEINPKVDISEWSRPE